VAVTLAVLAATKVEFKPKTPVFQSEAKLVTGGVGDKTENWQISQADFYGTIIETLESAEMKHRALERVRALNPDLKDRDVEIHAAQIKGSTMFRVQTLSEDRKYARIFLDALLDEFIGFRQHIHEQWGDRDIKKLREETVAAQKLMEEKLDELAEFKKFNNLMSLTTVNDQVAKMLGNLESQLEEQRMTLADLELTLRSVPAAMTMAQIKVSNAQPLTQTEKDYIQTQSELRRYENELKYLTENHKPDHPLLAETREKASKARFLLNALVDPLREEMTQREVSTRSKVTVLEKLVADRQQEALKLGTRIAQYDKLDRQAKAAKEAYEQLYEKSKLLQGMTRYTDFVAIQERARAATEVMQSGLVPVWKLWRSEPKVSAEESTPKPASKKKEPAKATS
jgi:succinoglycan biosynthesis transport protein ExoP